MAEMTIIGWGWNYFNFRTELSGTTQSQNLAELIKGQSQLTKYLKIPVMWHTDNITSTC